jgi:hypothetical protein
VGGVWAKIDRETRHFAPNYGFPSVGNPQKAVLAAFKRSSGAALKLLFHPDHLMKLGKGYSNGSRVAQS